MDNRPIGVFDSGFGGLTVVKEIIHRLPNEKIVYFGDTARIPYGSKSKETIIKYSKQIIRFLQTKDVKAVVIACGTASSTALDAVKETFKLPIIGVVEPAAISAVKKTNNNRIGVIGTEGTIASKAYNIMLNKNGNKDKLEVFSKACPLFVPLVEEGLFEDEVTTIVAKRYLQYLIEKDIDTLILGCTHYPLLTEVISDIMGNVELINPGNETAKVLENILEENNLKSESLIALHKFYVSDRANKFETFAQIILDMKIPPVEEVSIEDY